jgi:ABC-type Zn uptake system ZnuABC Zn-binding protein ZnuA
MLVTDLPIHRSRLLHILIIILGLVVGLSSCHNQPVQAESPLLNIVATTSLVGDVVSQVAGDKISLHVLLPIGTDPHSFSPTPRDASAIADATLVLANGAGLEEFLQPLIESAGGSAKIVEVSTGINFLSIADEDLGSNHLVDDPHTWMDPNNIVIWVDNIVHALSEQDPVNTAYYLSNGRSYQAKLVELDQWIRSQISTVPEEDRKIVTEHLIFGYFANRYGFTQAGAIIPGFSSLSAPSARDIAEIEDAIQSLGVKAIFIGVGVNANIAQRISDDTGIRMVSLYMHSLTQPGGEADNYIDFMRYHVASMVEAFK